MFLEHPYWLIALILLPLIVIAALMTSRTHRQRWAMFVASRLRQSLIRSGHPIPRWLSFSFLMAATLLIILGMTRPRGDGGTQSEKSVGRNLLVALDLSRSMRVDDVAPDRLSLAKLVIYEMLEEMPNDRIGLIGFAGEPHLYAPLTIDHAAVRETVEQMDENWPTLGGSDLGDAIELSIETLKETGQRNNAMVLLTDGEMHKGDLNQMITKAREAGVYIITVGVGTEDGGYVPSSKFPDGRMQDRQGNPVLSRLQADSLIELARETNGSFAIAGSGKDIPSMVKSAISRLEAFEVEGRERKVYIEFFQWLLLPAIVLLIGSLIAGTRWRGLTPASASAVIALGFCLPQVLGQEEPSPEQRSMERYRQKAEEALLDDHKARYRLGEASAAYRLQNWERASSAYSAALRSNDSQVLSTAHHGMGNTLFQKGWSRFLNEAYTAESLEGPSMERFETAVRAKLQQLKQGPAQQKPDEEQKTPSFKYSDIERCILDWTDSVRHFQSVLEIEAGHEGAKQNRELTLIYLRKLKELLEEDEQQSQDELSQMQPSPQPGDGEPNQQGDQGDEPQPDGDPQQNPGDNPDQPNEVDPNGNEGEPDPNAQPNPNQEPRNRENEGDEENPDMKPGETPEENARRRLREGADSEKGPLTPGRIKFRRPEKDW